MRSFSSRRVFKIFNFSSVLVCLYLCSYAQQQREFTDAENEIRAVSRAQMIRAYTGSDRALRIGDKVPDIVVDNVFNYPGGKVRLSDFKGKHIILDFWSRNCSSCIGAFPKMEKLQQQFNNKIQILAVCTYNTWEALNLQEPGFPKSSKSDFIRNTTLPLVFNSQDMVDFFPHISEPYLVWIDSARVIRAMIDSWNVNDQSIRTLLNGHYNAYPLAIAFKGAFKPAQYGRYDESFPPILEEGNGRNVNKIVYLKKSEKNPSDYVILGKLGITTGLVRNDIMDPTTNEQIGLRRLKLSIPELFRSAYPVNKQLVMVESTNIEKYYRPKISGVDKWFADYVFSFEVFGPTPAVRQAMLREALREYFHDIYPSIEKRRIRCLELRKLPGRDKLNTKLRGKESKAMRTTELLKLHNYSFQFFLTDLIRINLYEHGPKALPIFDATDIDPNHHIDIELKNVDDVAGLNVQLKQYGLILQPVEREEEVLVLRESTDSK